MSKAFTRSPCIKLSQRPHLLEISIHGDFMAHDQRLGTSFSQYGDPYKQSPERPLLAPSQSLRSSSSSGSPSRSVASTLTSTSGGSSRSGPHRLRKIDGEPALGGLRSLPDTPPLPLEVCSDSIPAVDTGHMKHELGTSTGSSEYSGSTAVTSSAESVCSGVTATGAVLTKLTLELPKEVTTGTISTFILLLKSGLGLENVLVTLGMLSHDPIVANMMYCMGASATLIEIFDSTQSENVTALALWCLARICRNVEIANGLLKQNLAKLLVTKGLKGTQRTACVAGWCLGALICSDSIADTLTEMGFVPALCDNMRHCSEWSSTSPENYSAAIYAVARISRSIKAAKVLAQCGCPKILARCLMTTDSPMVLLFGARAVGCLMGPDSSDMAKALLDAGVARGLARLPRVLSTDEVEPLGSFAFAIQRFSFAEWGGETKKALVEAGIVDSLLYAQRTAADETCPEVHIELAYAIALLGDVGGASIRKKIVNAGGIEILKRVGSSAARPNVATACNVAVKSITGNVWSRNAASAKVALVHEWSRGCPDHLPECPVLKVSDQFGPASPWFIVATVWHQLPSRKCSLHRFWIVTSASVSNTPQLHPSLILVLLGSFLVYFWPQVKTALPAQTSELVVTSLNWVGGKFLLGLSAGAFVTALALFFSLVRDVHEYFFEKSTASPSAEDVATPHTLEAGLKSVTPASRDGEGEPQNPQGTSDASASTDLPGTAAADLPPSLTVRPAGKIAAILFCLALFAADVWLRDIVSPQVSVLQNAGKVAMHFLAGLEVLVVAVMLLLAFMAWKSRGGAPLSSRWRGWYRDAA
ncbi:ARM repeat-containing protein [Mycena venus]|uniref:ARM repeat-containing protein n=1 Tax=Mycena venus TaxID=2733690 RepID=A0A8H7CIH7_9AGAR|nr:ARM repeat-containing protein [Mycena venus]